MKRLKKVRKRGYIAPGLVELLTASFAISEGENGIRLVYDESIGGLNLSIWVPRFFLPLIHTHLRAVERNLFVRSPHCCFVTIV
jgi:hypothetical protein